MSPSMSPTAVISREYPARLSVSMMLWPQMVICTCLRTTTYSKSTLHQTSLTGPRPTCHSPIPSLKAPACFTSRTPLTTNWLSPGSPALPSWSSTWTTLVPRLSWFPVSKIRSLVPLLSSTLAETRVTTCSPTPLPSPLVVSSWEFTRRTPSSLSPVFMVISFLACISTTPIASCMFSSRTLPSPSPSFFL